MRLNLIALLKMMALRGNFRNVKTNLKLKYAELKRDI